MNAAKRCISFFVRAAGVCERAHEFFGVRQSENLKL